MKYKRLTIEELQALEPEFINFLASAQITGGDWIKMKNEELEKAEEMVDVFSDMVYEKVLSKIKFLEYRDAKSLTIFNCAEDKIILVGLRVSDNSPLDLTASDVLAQWQQHNESGGIHIVRNERVYKEDRGIEVFELLQQGCLLTDDKLFTILMNDFK